MLIDGKKIAQNILEQIKQEVSQLTFKPVFCDVLVGDDPVSAQYVRMKASKAEKVGIKFRQANFAADIRQEDLINEIKKLNVLPGMCGLIVQLPLPPSFDRQTVLDAIDPAIDVDCTSTLSSKLFYKGENKLWFPTAAAVVAILDSLKLNLTDKNILVVGQGILVGRPVTFLLKQRGLLVGIADINTPDPDRLIKQADVIISAVGKGNLITGDKIKPGAAVIDAGTSESNGGVVGDADMDSVSKVASFLSPVPGGVGPVTVAMLLKNVLTVAKSKTQ